MKWPHPSGSCFDFTKAFYRLKGIRGVARNAYRSDAFICLKVVVTVLFCVASDATSASCPPGPAHTTERETGNWLERKGTWCTCVCPCPSFFSHPTSLPLQSFFSLPFSLPFSLLLHCIYFPSFPLTPSSSPPPYLFSPLLFLQQETLKTAQEERERLGVKLYGVQQQLARQQMLLEKEQDELSTNRTLREQRDVTLGQVREMYRQMQDQLKTERQQCKRIVSYAYMYM